MPYAQLVVSAIAEGAIYSLVALGLAFVLYPMRVFHGALGGNYVCAAYITGLMARQFGVPWYVGALVAVLASIGAGAVTERWVYWPLARKHASNLTVAISSFASYFVLVNLVAVAVGNQQMYLPRDATVWSLGEIVLSDTQLLMTIVAIGSLGLLLLFLRSRLGKVIRAMADGPELLQVYGWNTARLRLLCISLSSFFAGIAGVLTALDKGVEPGMGMPALLNGLVVVVAAGPGSYKGIFIIGPGLAILQALVGYATSPKWTLAVSFAVLSAFLLLRPSGLFSAPRRVEELV